MLEPGSHDSIPSRQPDAVRRSRFALTLALVAAGVAFPFDLGCSFRTTAAPGGTGGAGGPNDFDGSVGVFDMRPLDTGFVIAPDAPGTTDAAPCLQVLQAVVRDFRGYPGPNGEPKHPDFEYRTGDVLGIAAAMLGADSKPVYGPAGPTNITTGADAYAQWYRDVADVNMRFEIEIPLTPHPTKVGTFVYDNDAFFPIDNMGFQNQNQAHNFHFTSELHFEFPYRGGEVFTFRGDDDVWLFVNGILAIDLGGVHTAQTGTVDLDQMAATLGITPNNTYRMDIFQAERHTSQSTFHVETTLQCVTNIVIP